MVDDDVRNIFALTSLLEEHNMKRVFDEETTSVWYVTLRALWKRRMESLIILVTHAFLDRKPVVLEIQDEQAKVRCVNLPFCM